MAKFIQVTGTTHKEVLSINLDFIRVVRANEAGGTSLFFKKEVVTEVDEKYEDVLKML